MIWLSLVLFLLILQIFVILIKEHKEPYKLTAWLFIAFIIPLFGFFIFWMAAGGHRKNLPIEDAVYGSSKTCIPLLRDQRQTPYTRLHRYIHSISVYPPAAARNTKIYVDGQSFFDDLLEDLEQANEHIHMEFYIFRDDALGHRVAELLKRKAAEGVEVRCIIDGIGSLSYPKKKIEELIAGGVEVHVYMPAGMSILHKRLNYRNHRKIVICDGRIGYWGGMNVGSEYMGDETRLGYWRDTQMRVAGDAVYGLQHTFLRDWVQVSGQPWNGSDELLRGMSDSRGERTNKGGEDQDLRGDLIQFITSGPHQAHHAIHALYYGMFSAAQSSIYVTTPYFIPDDGIKMALISAAKSGLDVRILIPGRPDSRLIKLATLSHLEELMREGVRVYEYQPGFIHAKMIIIDSLYATVGTANVDMRSFFSNFELNAMIYSESHVKQLEKIFFEDLQRSEEIDYRAFASRSQWRRMKEAGARILSPLL